MFHFLFFQVRKAHGKQSFLDWTIAIAMTAIGFELGPAWSTTWITSVVRAQEATELGPPSRIVTRYLPNAILVHRKVISGGQPEGENAFIELKRLGVKTIISVDGVRPAVELATKFGMSTIHLPHGYDGISPERIEALAMAVRDFEGPIYIHCHHGKHRSPAAAVVACVSTGMLAPADALKVLAIAGTNPNYRGLFQAAGSARRMEDARLDAVRSEFPEIAQLPPMTESMVAVDRLHDRLKQLAGADDKSLLEHDDVDPIQAALLLAEHFTELLRTDSASDHPAEFRTLLKESETDCIALELALRNWKESGSQSGSHGSMPEVISVSLNRLSAKCVTCHQSYRDNSIREGK